MTPNESTAKQQPDDPEQLREEIGQNREELGETVEALAQKADVKAQVKTKAGETAGQVKQRPIPIGAALAAALGALLLVRLVRRR